ncbi:MAG TPA: pyridoxamine 5'-phosphate oxidase family protein [Pyrinomonadaceae bacterium]|jgi:hypothetical protein
MAKFYTELDNSLRRFIGEQKIFFTASAPNDGRVNLSPKGMDSFRCLDRKTVAYLDLTGSGNETAAHIFENGRLTIMFCSFTEKPLILRLYGRGRVVRKNDEDWNRLYSNFTPIIGERQIIVLEIESLQTSCGFAVPVYELKEEREKLVEWAENKGESGLLEYRQTKNKISIDGLPTFIDD